MITAALGSRWFGPAAGIAAGLVQAVSGPLALVETSLYAEGLLIFATLLSVYALTTRGSSPGGIFVTGVLLGAAAIVRSTALVLVPVFLWKVVVEQVPAHSRARRALLFVAGLALVTIPIAVKNARNPFGSFQLQGYAGLNFYIGNSPAGVGMATYRLGSGWDTLSGEAARNGVVGGNREDRYYLRKTLSEIASRPAAWLGLLARKAIWSVQADEIRDSSSFSFFAEAVPFLRWLPGFGLLFSLAAVGALVNARNRQMPFELVGWIVAIWATIVLLVVGLRYRMPLVPPLSILAGAGVVALSETARRLMRPRSGTHEATPDRWRAGAILAAVAIAAALLSHLWRHAPSHALSEEWALTGAALNSERRLSEAESAYRRALGLDERSALAWKGLGIVLYNTNRLEDARAAHERALALDPGFADAYLRLAFTESRLGRLDTAVQLLRQGAGILPTDVAIRRVLGQHLFATQDYRGAARELEWVLSRNPSDPMAEKMLADARRRIE